MTVYKIKSLKSPLIDQDINLDIPYSRIGFFGPSGGGKSSFIKLFSGDLSYVKGYFLLLGERICWKKIGLQSQENFLYNSLTVEEHFKLIGHLDEGVQLLQKLGHGHLLKRHGGFSGGQKQLIFFIMVFITKKFKILMLDEPTSALDKNTKEKISSLLSCSNKNYWIISHDLKFLQKTCKYFIFIDNKQIVEAGTDIIKNPRTNQLKQFMLQCNQ